MSGSLPVSVVETPEFLTTTRKLMDEDERADLSQEDKNEFRRLTKLLVESYARRRR